MLKIAQQLSLCLMLERVNTSLWIKATEEVAENSRQIICVFGQKVEFSSNENSYFGNLFY